MARSLFGRRRRNDRPTGLVGDHADKLSRIPAIPHDPDERPTREDMQPPPGVSRLFQIPVPVPKFLTPRRDRLKR
jgi:hypothetical protein